MSELQLRCGSSLNTHVHFHVCVVDGVFEAQPDGVAFHAATGRDEAAFSQVQANVRKLRILRAFVSAKPAPARAATPNLLQRGLD